MGRFDLPDSGEFTQLVDAAARMFGNFERVCGERRVPRDRFVKYRRAYATLKIADLMFAGTSTPQPQQYLRWLEPRKKDGQSFGGDFSHPRWQLYEQSGRLLTDLYENAGGFQLPPSMPSFFGDGGTATVQHGSAAIWLCKHIAPFMETVVAQVSPAQAPHLSPASLIAKIYDVLTTETRFLGNDEALDVIARVLFALGVGILPADTDWSRHLREFVELQLESSSGSGYERPIVRWALGVETDESPAPLDARVESFADLERQNADAARHWQLNNWAYILLRLDLHRAATPLAKAAVETEPWSGAYDTYGWALFYEKQYDEAEEWTTRALAGLGTTRGSDWLEVQYHRAQIAFWSDRMTDAAAIIEEMLAKDAKDYWSKRAAGLKALIPRETVRRSADQRFEFDVAISYAGPDRRHADELARVLTAKGLRVFFDDFQRGNLWGADLYKELTAIYQTKAKYCVILVSRNYELSRWTTLEWRAAQARAYAENQSYILPVRLDSTELPGLAPGIAYLSWDADGVDWIAALLLEKLGIATT